MSRPYQTRNFVWSWKTDMSLPRTYRGKCESTIFASCAATRLRCSLHRMILPRAASFTAVAERHSLETKSLLKRIPALACSWLLPLTLWAGEVSVLDATAVCSQDACTINATLSHADSGWDHYADHWRVLTPEGEEIGRRVLLHPHVNEQPFTRGLTRIRIPQGLKHVDIEAHDNVHGYGKQRFRLELR